MKTIVFFNNRGGVGKSALVYHLAWMYAELGVRVVAADLDPQANLSSMLLDEERIEACWSATAHRLTVYGAMRPLLEGSGELVDPHTEYISEQLALLIGDLALSAAEDELQSQWSRHSDYDQRALRVLSAVWHTLERAARQHEASLVLIDVGPHLGAINRSVLIAAEDVVIPLALDLYSLQGLHNVGPALRRWRDEWRDRLGRSLVGELSLPQGLMRPAGYLVLQHAVPLDRTVSVTERWMGRIPLEYRAAILGQQHDAQAMSVADDPLCLALLKHYRSLMPLAQQARKPMFLLKSADGAIGSHARAVQACYKDFRLLAQRIAQSVGLTLPPSGHGVGK